MSKDNWDDQDEKKLDFDDSAEDSLDAESLWGDEDESSESTDSLLTLPTDEDDNQELAEDMSWDDDEELSGSEDPITDLGDDWDDDDQHGFSAKDDDDYDEDHEDDASSTGSSGSSSHAAEDKKKSKLKTYALIGGMSVFVAGILGAGYMVTKGNKTPAQPRPQQAVMPQDPVYVSDQMPVGEDQYVIDAEPDFSPSNVIMPPVEMDLDMEPRIQERPIDRGIPAVNSEAMTELTDKADMLAAAMTQFKQETDDRLNKIEESAEQTKEALSPHEKRISELEAQVKELSAFIATLKEREEKAAQAKAKAEEVKAKVAQRKPEAKRAASSKASVKPATKPATRPAQPAKTARSASGVGGYSVVATYPSTSAPGMAPEKAWVTNGEKLVQVIVGSVVNGAKVTRIEGTTVFTSHGVIRSPR